MMILININKQVCLKSDSKMLEEIKLPLKSLRDSSSPPYSLGSIFSGKWSLSTDFPSE